MYYHSSLRRRMMAITFETVDRSFSAQTAAQAEKQSAPTATCIILAFQLAYPFTRSLHLTTTPAAANANKTARGGTIFFQSNLSFSMSVAPGLVSKYRLANNHPYAARQPRFTPFAHTSPVCVHPRPCVKAQDAKINMPENRIIKLDCVRNAAGDAVAEWNASKSPLIDMMGR